MTVRNTLLLVLLAGSLLLLSAWALLTLRPLVVTVPLEMRPITALNGKTFLSPVPALPFSPWLAVPGDSLSNPMQSATVIFEDRVALGPAHAQHIDIGRDGAGRFSHWYSTLYFSTSDGSDPRYNGRVYVAEFRATPSIWFTLVAAFLPLILVELIARAQRGNPSTALRTFLKVRALVISTCQEDRLFILAIGVAVCVLAKPFDFVLKSTGDHLDLVRIGVVAIIIAIGIGWKSNFTPSPYLLASRLFTLALGIFGLLRSFPIDFEVGFDSFVSWHHLVFAPKVGLISALLAWWRPAFGFYAACSNFWYRQEIERQYGLVLGHGEEATMVYTLMLMLFIGLLLHIWEKLGSGLFQGHNKSERHLQTTATRNAALNNVLLLAVALQFSNYYYSALAKWRLGDGGGDWIAANTTHYLLSSAEILGTLPIEGLLGAKVWIAETWASHYLAVNVTIWVLQAISLPLLWIKPLLGPAIIVFDLWHVSVAMLTGIVFWIWIIINLVLAVCVLRIPRKPSIALRLLMTVLLLAAPRFAPIFEAAWYDTRAVNQTRIWAVNRDGTVRLVPPQVFRFYSYMAIMGSFYEPGEMKKTFFPTTGYGTAYSDAVRESSQNCQLPETERAELPALQPGVLRVLRAVHATAARETTHWFYYIYPHHLFAEGDLKQYLETDFSNVTAYRFEVSAKCAAISERDYHIDNLRHASRDFTLDEIGITEPTSLLPVGGQFHSTGR